jgi:hypothetical protein
MHLNVCGQRFVKGSRIRLALSSSYWPIIFPAPKPVTLTLTTGQSRLILPVRAPRPEDAALSEFAPPEGAAPLESEILDAGSAFRRTVTQDLISGVQVYERGGDSGAERHAHTGLTVRYVETDRFTIHPADPTTAKGECFWRKSYRRGDWVAEVETETRVEALSDVWRIRATLIAYENGAEIFRRTFSEDVPRDLC